jgi:ubiquinone/menaquinone biosynthesis C-methylase UbiE
VSQLQTQAAANPAQAFEDYLGLHQFRPWARELLDRARPQPGERILDLACGTGIVARLTLEQLDGRAQMAALDPSVPMLDVGRATAVREGVAIEWHEGRAEAMPFADASFDLVLMQQGLQFFQDKAAGLSETHRVLVPGGRVVSSTWTALERNPFSLAFAEVIHRHLGTPAMHTPFALGDRSELQAMFASAGFHDIHVDVATLDIRLPSPDRFVEMGLAGASAAVPALQAMSGDERAALTAAVRADMEEPLRRFGTEDSIVMPMETHIVNARKP